ncbi:MAG: S-adenosylmethionine:tRNA ribosyltransferase-isomerase [Paludibacteraceae bacterium]|nr:S-adenosylmethionine:tRNA ribosyltransferase-isomerase [Paludibacteraceae bacterium]
MKQSPQSIRIEEYDYPLPESRIAKFPLSHRDESKLLVYRNGEIAEHRFFDLPDLLESETLLVRNNTRVIQARLLFEKETGARIELFCLEPHDPSDYAQAFQETGSCVWKCLVGNSKKWKEGKIHSMQRESLKAERLEDCGETSLIRFSWTGEEVRFGEILESVGELPIPPYLHRKTEESDKISYQTVYSKIKGSVAAPTAGLHFTPETLEKIAERGIETEEVTLHVGAGTFKPVKSEEIGGHTMHSEVITVKASTIRHIREKLGHIVAVGTTSVRTLESLYFIGVMLERDMNAEDLRVKQWMPYEDYPPISTEKALDNILEHLQRTGREHLQTSTQIIIAPGYEFHVVSRLITNFHQPQSTLLLLISAYLKGDWRRVYDYALEHDFRFLSYGDSSLLIKE